MNLQEADRHFIHTYNRSVIFEKGEGMYLFDNEGNKYLDMGAGIAVSACRCRYGKNNRSNFKKLLFFQ